jgi:hypothetical protein
MQQIKHSRVVVTHVPGSVVPKVFVEPCQGIRDVFIAPTVDESKAFSSMGMEQPQAVFRSGLDGRLRLPSSPYADRREDSQATPEPALSHETYKSIHKAKI